MKEYQRRITAGPVETLEGAANLEMDSFVSISRRLIQAPPTQDLILVEFPEKGIARTENMRRILEPSEYQIGKPSFLQLVQAFLQLDNVYLAEARMSMGVDPFFEHHPCPESLSSTITPLICGDLYRVKKK